MLPVMVEWSSFFLKCRFPPSSPETNRNNHQAAQKIRRSWNRAMPVLQITYPVPNIGVGEQFFDFIIIYSPLTARTYRITLKMSMTILWTVIDRTFGHILSQTELAPFNFEKDQDN